MGGTAAQTAFWDRVSELESARGESVRVDEIAEVVESLLASLDGDLTSFDLRLYHELDHLVQYIRKAKDEIADLCPVELRHDAILDAADQLDAIVTHTEEATSQILDNAETIEKATESLEAEAKGRIREAVTRIYEACNFQDITGQRITKVVRTLKHIEEELDKLLAVFGIETTARPGAKKAESGKEGDRLLMNGPQLPEEANKQAEIDALLASFD